MKQPYSEINSKIMKWNADCFALNKKLMDDYPDTANVA